ncbi:MULTISPECIES: site-2 protease family protein [Arthrospira]|jgi:Zn-dependent protease|uniref:Zinc metalloprotease n=1 Tax=Limnospira platensis NIES-46 TaxID=1236695 RepID=A0A5M3TAH4_LIMPL|nr:site-2 protease family protein [Arthrospira platensis]AMW28995.1 Zn-dependent protease [Arthrospira platensis YZ]KDR56545.1 Zn-dependent protease [Arthrospira platensis str. Paraca]MBD2671193.1 site-2 protease family protein [Arthrospira platensis FACHB-439]MBD2712125.1 site-2 protease family protein [Arthrospira platensis FACHB-835]MDF2212806.1 site-2 protease family protein [Arthrospira platensis NCB002]MDT9183727.1 site-2 protease family protein [Limnospira sp. PMC 289.06]MDT9295820.1 
MQAGWRIGSIFGIPLYIDSSWFVIVVLVTLLNSQEYVQWGELLSWGAGLAVALLLFGSVLLHELGHSLIAKSQGIQVNSITLFLFGGIASIEKESKTPGQAFQVAIAGPLVSLALFFVLTALAQSLPEPNLVREIAQRIGEINLVLAIFNLIPGLPLDGGQVLKATVWQITGSRFAGVRWAARSGQFLGWGAIFLGLFALFAASNYSGLWIALIGLFVIRNASSYSRMSDLQETLLKIQASDVMSREFRVIDAEMTLRQFADDYLICASSIPVFFAASSGRYRGFVSVDKLRMIERSQWETQTLNDIVTPLDQLIAVPEKALLVEVINKMESQGLPRITVLSPAGAVSGIIDRGDVVRAVAKYLKVPIPEANIKRIKEDGSYPPGLPLDAIAKTAASYTEN